HFVGASLGSTDVRRTLRRLCCELKAHCEEVVIDIPEDAEILRSVFAECLQQAAAKKKVVIILDAVDQFDSAVCASRLSWLPVELPPNVRFILSTPDGTSLDDLRRRSCRFREIELMPLTVSDGRSII